MNFVAIRLGRVLEKVPYGRSALLSMVKEGRFPAPIRLGEHAVAWVEAEVDRWLEARIAERDAGIAVPIRSPNPAGRPRKPKAEAAPAPAEPALPAPRRRRRSGSAS